MESNVPNFLLKWLRLFLILLPIAITAYSIYWTIFVTEPIFLAACGAGCTVLAVLLMVFALLSSLFAFLSFRQLNNLNYQSLLFSLYLIFTIVGFLLIVIALIMTTTESQRVFDIKISTYLGHHTDSKTQSYYKTYSTQYKQIVYQYAYGQKSYEAYLIIGAAWFIAFIAFLTTAENSTPH